MHSPSIQIPCVPPRDKPRSRIPDSYDAIAFDAMGCRFELLIDADRSPLDRVGCRGVLEACREIVYDWHHRLSVFEPGSIMSRFNRLKAGVPFSLDEDMYDFVELCDQLRVETDGAFNIAAGTLMHSFGFRGSEPNDLRYRSLNLDHAIDLDSRNGTITKVDDRVSLDFGAIAKGYVLDLIQEELHEFGMSNAYLHGGTSSIVAMGVDHIGSPWSTRLGDGTTIRHSGFAIGVSRYDARMIRSGSDQVGHLMDTRTNTTTASDVVESVCIHSSAAVADALSTAYSISPSMINRLRSDTSVALQMRISTRSIIHDPLGAIDQSTKDTA